jgi:hypothetical protein
MKNAVFWDVTFISDTYIYVSRTVDVLVAFFLVALLWDVNVICEGRTKLSDFTASRLRRRPSWHEECLLL